MPLVHDKMGRPEAVNHGPNSFLRRSTGRTCCVARRTRSRGRVQTLESQPIPFIQEITDHIMSPQIYILPELIQEYRFRKNIKKNSCKFLKLNLRINKGYQGM